MCDVVKCICKEITSAGMANWITAVATCFTALAAILTFLVARKQLKKISNTDSSRFILELRNTFSEERRWNVYRAMQNKTLDQKYIDNNEVAVIDYLGMFEILEKMLELKTISIPIFKSFYYYRLKCILGCNAIIKYIEEDDGYWDGLCRLFKRFPELKEEYYETPEQILFWEKIEDE